MLAFIERNDGGYQKLKSLSIYTQHLIKIKVYGVNSKNLNIEIHLENKLQ